MSVSLFGVSVSSAHAGQTPISIAAPSPPLPTLTVPPSDIAGATIPATNANASVLSAVKLFIQSFQPELGEQSLLAYARTEKLDWAATQNLFKVQVVDERNHFLEWRGHTGSQTGSVFTTLRAATFIKSRAVSLLVINREWCSAGACQTRNSFHWVENGQLKPEKETTVIPLLRDADFYLGSVPPCLKGVSLGVNYIPARKGANVSALAILPADAAKKCRNAGVSTEKLTRPLNLIWNVSAAKFRKGW